MFVATPFSPQRAGGEDPATFARVQASIKAAAEEAGVELDHPQAVQEAGWILDQILDRLTEADAVLGIVTGGNPNVLFEIGFAARRTPILITDDPEKLPFDLRIYRTIGYGGPGELDTLTDRIRGAIVETLAAAETRMDPAIQDYLSAVDRYARALPSLLPESLAERFQGDLLQLYVPLRLHALSQPAGAIAERVLEPKAILAQLRNGQGAAHCLLLGGSGSGKTTLLRVLAAHAWHSPKEIGLSDPRLPLLVSLRSLARSPGVLIAARLKNALDEDRRLTLSQPPPEEFISTWARRTRRSWLFLLDGLDEVPREQRPDLWIWIGEFLDYCLKNGHHVILTSRPLPSLPKVLTERVTAFEVEPLDSDPIESLSRSFLGADTEQFLLALDRSRLRIRLRNPLLLTLAAALYRNTGSLPARRVVLIAHLINTVLEHNRERHLDERLGKRIAASVRPLLERIALSLSEKPEVAVEEFLHTELGMAKVEARARAESVLQELASSSGVLVRAGDGYSFSHLVFLEHLVACHLRSTPVFRDGWRWVPRWWDSERRDIVLSFFGMLEDERKISTLLRKVYPTSWLQRVRMKDWADKLQRCRFVVDCILDGCAVDRGLQRTLMRDLDHLAKDAEVGPAAAELLGLLGDHSALFAWAQSREAEPSAAAYALAALYRLGEVERISTLVWNESLPRDRRLMALTLVMRLGGSSLPAELLEAPEMHPELKSASVFFLVETEQTEELRRLVREGRITGRALDTLAAACALKRDLGPLFDLSEDDQVIDEVRDAVSECVVTATAIMLKQLAEDAGVDRAVRTAAAWLIGVREGPVDPAPLLTTPVLPPGSKFAVALVLLDRDPSQLKSISERWDIPINVRTLAVEVLDGAERDEELEQIVTAEDADPEIRSLALINLFSRDPYRVVMHTLSIPAESPIYEAAGLVRETFTREIQEIVRNMALDDGKRLSAMSVLADAGFSAAYRDLIKDPGPDDRIATVAVSVAAQQGAWTLLVEIVRDGDIREVLRAAAIGLLHQHQRTAELREIVEATDVPDTFRILASQYQSGPSPD